MASERKTVIRVSNMTYTHNANMPFTVPAEQEAAYSAIIDDILASSDLTTISAKRIRKGLQDRVSYDITPQKAAITDLIMQRFDKFQQQQEQANGTTPPAEAVPVPAPTTNGVGTYHPPKEEFNEPSESASPAKRKVSDDDDLSDVIDSPPPKKVKKAFKPSHAETDEELAKRMQAELNASARGTRGGGAPKRKAAPKKPKVTPKKKSKAKINSDDDSNLSDSSKPEKEKKGGFHKPMILSAALGEMLGESQLSRPQTVKKIWAYVKERDLQDPSDKRQIRCDERMRAVFKQERVHMFTMNKLLAHNLWPAEEGVVVEKEEEEG